MALPNRYSAGDDIVLPMTVYHNGVVQDISGWTIKAAIVDMGRKTLANGTAVVDCTITDGPTGEFTATFPADETDVIVPGDYYVEVQFTNDGKIRTPDRVKITILAQGIIPDPVPAP
jgi:hypothetical protein